MDVRLRPVHEDDLPIFFEHQRDPLAVEMAAFASREREAFDLHWTTNVLGNPEVIKRTIVCDGQVAGNVVCFERAGKQEIGYWIGREFWGKGIATEALRSFLLQVDQRPLHAIVARHNIGSFRVLEKCGFVVEAEIQGSPGASGPDVEEFLMRLDATDE